MKERLFNWMLVVIFPFDLPVLSSPLPLAVMGEFLGFPVCEMCEEYGGSNEYVCVTQVAE